MRKAIMALMDSEKDYAARFMELVNRRRTAPYDLYAFTDFSVLTAFVERKRPEVLLISEKDLSPAVLLWRLDLTAVLSERRGREESPLSEAGEGDGPDMRDSLRRLPRISKYQTASGILREITALRAEAEREASAPSGGGSETAVLKRGMKTVGVFSPVGRSLKTALAAAIGQSLARRKPTLFLSLDACTGFQTLLHETYESNLSDAFYYIRCGERQVMRKVLPMAREIGQMVYLPPFCSAQELYSVTAEEWRMLLDEIRTDSVYEALVLDLGEIPLLHPSILEECDRIYMPVAQDGQAKAKIAEFESILKREAMEPVGGKIRRIRLGRISLPESMDRWYERLPYSGLGKVAEQCIEEDRL